MIENRKFKTSQGKDLQTNFYTESKILPTNKLEAFKLFKRLIFQYTNFLKDDAKNNAEYKQNKLVYIQGKISPDTYSLQLKDLSDLMGVSKNRVRGIVNSCHCDIVNLIRYSILNIGEFRIDISLSAALQHWFKNLHSHILFNEDILCVAMLDQTKKETSDEDFVFIILAAEIYGFLRTGLKRFGKNSTSFFIQRSRKRAEYFVRLNFLYVEIKKNIIPITISQLHKRMNTKFPTDFQIVEMLCINLPGVETYENHKHSCQKVFGISLSSLVNINHKIIWILNHVGHPLNRKEIIDNINVIDSENPLELRQFNGVGYDKRIQPIGRKGLYSLAEWNLNTDSIKDLIVKTFNENDRSLTISEICLYITEIYGRKDVERESVMAIVSKYKKFRNLRNSFFELA